MRDEQRAARGAGANAGPGAGQDMDIDRAWGSLDARLAEITRRLTERYPSYRPLLQYGSPFQLLIAVILSAQTTDAQVNRVTPALFGSYPNAARLAEAELSELEAIVRPTGFFRSKARNIRAAAAALRDGYGGEVPREMDELTALPGVGRKTANVVRGTAFGLPAIIVDTHFARVCRRLGLTHESDPEKIERELATLVPSKSQYAFSMTVNFHGRDTCTARRPGCGSCFLGDLCPYPGPGGNGEPASGRSFAGAEPGGGRTPAGESSSGGPGSPRRRTRRPPEDDGGSD